MGVSTLDQVNVAMGCGESVQATEGEERCMQIWDRVKPISSKFNRFLKWQEADTPEMRTSLATVFSDTCRADLENERALVCSGSFPENFEEEVGKLNWSFKSAEGRTEPDDQDEMFEAAYVFYKNVFEMLNDKVPGLDPHEGQPSAGHHLTTARMIVIDAFKESFIVNDFHLAGKGCKFIELICKDCYFSDPWAKGGYF